MTLNNEADWDRRLKAFTHAVNTAVNRSTGRPPAELLFRFRPRTAYQNLIGEAVEVEPIPSGESAGPEGPRDQDIHDRLTESRGRDQSARNEALRPLSLATGDVIMIKTGFDNGREGKSSRPPFEGPSSWSRTAEAA